MENGIILFITFGAIILLIIFIQYFLRKSSAKDLELLDQHWEDFQESLASNDIEKISLTGEKLIYNKHLKQDQLNQITKAVSERTEDHPELETLKLKAFNKQLDYNKTVSGYDSLP